MARFFFLRHQCAEYAIPDTVINVDSMVDAVYLAVSIVVLQGSP